MIGQLPWLKRQRNRAWSQKKRRLNQWDHWSISMNESLSTHWTIREIIIWRICAPNSNQTQGNCFWRVFIESINRAFYTVINFFQFDKTLLFYCNLHWFWILYTQVRIYFAWNPNYFEFHVKHFVSSRFILVLVLVGFYVVSFKVVVRLAGSFVSE